MSSHLEIYKGSDAHIRNTLTDIVDGRLMFAVDTKQIYLDYDVPDGALSGPERIKFGGSTGIFYAEENNQSCVHDACSSHGRSYDVRVWQDRGHQGTRDRQRRHYSQGRGA